MKTINQFTQDEKEVIEVLDRVAKEGQEKKIKGDYQWTIRIKELLAELGQNKRFYVCTAGLKDKTVKEWLFDVVWYKEEEESRMLVYVPLVLECEWNRNIKDIKYDFEKLLLANSEMRFMICQAKDNNQIDKVFAYFKKAVSVYRDIPEGSRFVCAVLDDCNSGMFKYELIIKEL